MVDKAPELMLEYVDVAEPTMNLELLQRSMRISKLAHHLEGTKCAVGFIENDGLIQPSSSTMTIMLE